VVFARSVKRIFNRELNLAVYRVSKAYEHFLNAAVANSIVVLIKSASAFGALTVGDAMGNAGFFVYVLSVKGVVTATVLVIAYVLTASALGNGKESVASAVLGKVIGGLLKVVAVSLSLFVVAIIASRTLIVNDIAVVAGVAAKLYRVGIAMVFHSAATYAQRVNYYIFAKGERISSILTNVAALGNSLDYGVHLKTAIGANIMLAVPALLVLVVPLELTIQAALEPYPLSAGASVKNNSSAAGYAKLLKVVNLKIILVVFFCFAGLGVVAINAGHINGIAVLAAVTIHFEGGFPSVSDSIIVVYVFKDHYAAEPILLNRIYRELTVFVLLALAVRIISHSATVVTNELFKSGHVGFNVFPVATPNVYFLMEFLLAGSASFYEYVTVAHTVFFGKINLNLFVIVIVTLYCFAFLTLGTGADLLVAFIAAITVEYIAGLPLVALLLILPRKLENNVAVSIVGGVIPIVRGNALGLNVHPLFHNVSNSTVGTGYTNNVMNRAIGLNYLLGFSILYITFEVKP